MLTAAQSAKKHWHEAKSWRKDSAMRIEVINTGTELLLGTTVNTHGAWFGQALFKLGLRVQRQSTVPDGDAIGDEIIAAIERSDAILITGGLGPTSDDITREIVAKILERDLIQDEHAVRTLKHFFASRGKEMAEVNLKQTYLPVGAEIMPNPNGTAPGIYVPPRIGKGCALFLLPGPPNEVYPMFENEVAPRLTALVGGESPQEFKELKFTGIGESELHQAVDAELDAVADLEFGYCARPGEVDCRLIGSELAVAEGDKILKQAYGEYCISDDGKNMAQIIIDLFEEDGHTLAIAESCTGGYVASRLTDEAGASAAFDQSVVTYSNASKTALLGVPAELIEEHGAVSREVAVAMAEGALDLSNDDYALAITGIAGPGGGTDEMPVGTVFIALAQYDHPTYVIRRLHRRNRKDFKFVVSQDALDMARRRMLEFSDLQDRF